MGHELVRLTKLLPTVATTQRGLLVLQALVPLQHEGDAKGLVTLVTFVLGPVLLVLVLVQAEVVLERLAAHVARDVLGIGGAVLGGHVGAHGLARQDHAAELAVDILSGSLLVPAASHVGEERGLGTGSDADRRLTKSTLHS